MGGPRIGSMNLAQGKSRRGATWDQHHHTTKRAASIAERALLFVSLRDWWIFYRQT